MNFTNDRDPKIVLERLAEFESQLSQSLPADYRSFLLEHNGGVPERQLFQIPDCQGEALVDHFLGIERPYEDILVWMEELKRDLPEGFLPIGFEPDLFGHVRWCHLLLGSFTPFPWFFAHAEYLLDRQFFYRIAG